MEHLRAVAQRLRQGRRAQRQNHEFLYVDAVVRVRAAVDDVHLRHRQDELAGPSQVPVQRQLAILRRGVRGGERHGENRVRAELRFVVRAVRRRQLRVERALVLGVQADRHAAQLAVDVGDGLQDSLAPEPLGVAVAQLNGFARAGGCAGGHGRAAEHAGFEQHIRLDGGITSRIDDFAASNIADSAHSRVSSNGCFFTARSNSLRV